MERVRLSDNFFLDEFTRSEVAARQGREIAVEPDSLVCYAVTLLVRDILQPLRTALGPVHVLSGVRPPWLNQLVGGSPHSQHILGLAADVVVTGHTPLEVCRWIHEAELPFDQLIHEFRRWTHVSVAPYGTPRREQITAVSRGGTTHYLTGLHEAA